MLCPRFWVKAATLQPDECCVPIKPGLPTKGYNTLALCGETMLHLRLQETRTYWFNAATLEPDDEFMLIGLVLGLAIYNAVILDFPLPLALYKKLLGQQTTLRDLQDMDPTLGKSLQALLSYEGAFLLSFPRKLHCAERGGLPGALVQQTTLRDLQDMDPTLGKSLQALLSYEGVSYWSCWWACAALP